jgi:hypothetical protein
MTVTTRSISDYSNTTNPWHNWIQDNAPEFRDFISKTQQLHRLVANGQWDNLAMAKRLEQYIVDNGLDRNAALDAWIAYEVFKADLSSYRLAKAGA